MRSEVIEEHRKRQTFLRSSKWKIGLASKGDKSMIYLYLTREFELSRSFSTVTHYFT